MHDVLVALVIAGSVCTAICIAAAVWIHWRMRHHLRIRPGTKSMAPTSWVLSTSEPARLQRRLRRIAASARAAGSAGGPATESLARQIEDEAVRLEVSLVALSRIWRSERSARRELAAQVTELERLTVRLATSAADASRPALGPGTLNGLDDLRERLDALDEARRELSTVERQTGLGAG